MLGRETALQPVEWNAEGWPRLRGGGTDPLETPPLPDLPAAPLPQAAEVLHFDGPELPPELLTLREPPSAEWCSLSERPGWLRLRGRMSLNSSYEQSLVGRRIQSFDCAAETLLEFSPTHYLQTAGLAAFYDDEDWLYLARSFDEESGPVLRLMCKVSRRYSEPAQVSIAEGPVRLRAVLSYPDLQFFWSQDGDWQPIGPVLDAGHLTDDTGTRYRFTGAFFVLCAQDHTEGEIPADFQSFSLSSRPSP
jgi:xylan 1,4-beta-xylosidase